MVGWKLKHSILQVAFPLRPRSAADTAANSGYVYSGCPPHPRVVGLQQTSASGLMKEPLQSLILLDLCSGVVHSERD